MLKHILSVLCLSLVLASCTPDVDTTCRYDACSVKAPVSEINAVRDYLASANIQATEHCSGMFYKIDSVGSGRNPVACGGVAVRYTGRLTDGRVFDQQTGQPVTLHLSTVIAGWRNGLPQVKEGGKITLYIPPSLGYGNQDVRDRNTGAVIIPANSILIFDVRVDGIY